MGSLLGSFLIPGLIIGVVLGLVFVAMAVASRYIKVSPNEIAVFSGRTYKYTMPDGQIGKRGFTIVTGGGRILMPIVEKHQSMSTAAFQIMVDEDKIPTAKNVRVNVSGVATCKISDKPESMVAAVQSCLGKSDEEIREFIKNILNGHLRSIVGKMEIDQLLRKRDDFNKMVIEESTTELARLGFDLMSIVIRDINDIEGFIDALGKQAVAEVKRDAEIKVAEAGRDTEIKVAEAARDTRVKVSEADRLAAEATAQNQALISEAQKNLAVKQATYKQETEQRRAVAEKAFEIADAEQGTKLAVVLAERDSTSAKAQAEVQVQEASRKKQELHATLIVQAEAEREAAVIRADGQKQSAVITAEANKDVAGRDADRMKLKAGGEREAAIALAEGKKSAAIAEGEGEASRTKSIAIANAEGEKARLLAAAEGNKAGLLAAAEGNKAGLLATAEGNKAGLLAIAEGEKAKLLAAAEGQLKMAQALKELSEQGKLIIILDKLPGILEKGGEAGAKMLAEMFGPVGAAIGGIDQVTILDNGNGANGVGKLAGNVPAIVMGFVQQMKASGIDISSILKKLGIDANVALGMIPALETKVVKVEEAKKV
jgi:flotillin